METVSISNLIPGKTFDKNLGLSPRSLFLLPGMELTNSDLQSFLQWKLKNVYLIDDEDVSAESLEEDLNRFKTEKELYFGVIDQVLKELSSFYDEIMRRGSSSIKNISNSQEECLSILRRNKDFMKIAMFMHLPKKSSLEVDSLKTAIYSLIIGMQLKMEEEKLKELFDCAVLINVGMLKMKQLMNKPDKLTPQELQIVQSHPIVGYNIVKDKMKLGNLYSLVVLTHHENVDGSGYPRRLTGEKIPLYAKIISVAEEYVALGSEKPYRKIFSLYDAMRTLIAEGKKRFDQTVVSALLANLSLYPVGSVIQMNDGRTGMVISSNPKVPLRPIVRILVDENKNPVPGIEVMDLVNTKNAFIKSCLTDEDQIESVYRLI